MSTDVVIVDNGGANINSLSVALHRLGASTVLSRSPEQIRNAKRVLLPGVGAAIEGMQRLTRFGLLDLIPQLQQPVLGVCLGMQLLFEHTEEGNVTGLGICRGSARKLVAECGHRVPNMGWCPVEVTKKHPLLEGIATDEHFYFLHSYAIAVNATTCAAASHRDRFSAVVSADNFMGVQFHPERSSTAGARLLSNFLALNT